MHRRTLILISLMIRQLSRELHHTVLLCTHNLVEAEQLCDRVAVMRRGRLLALGTPAELARKLGRGHRIEVEVAPEGVPHALEAFSALPQVVVESHEHGVIVLKGVEREAIPDALRALVTRGVRVYGLAPREASLEEVYFALQGEEVSA